MAICARCLHISLQCTLFYKMHITYVLYFIPTWPYHPFHQLILISGPPLGSPMSLGLWLCFQFANNAFWAICHVLLGHKASRVGNMGCPVEIIDLWNLCEKVMGDVFLGLLVPSTLFFQLTEWDDSSLCGAPLNLSQICNLCVPWGRFFPVLFYLSISR